ncbi:hypothetical protein [Amorphus sp. 3PC139-8]|uniref:hypothetical protein n=1 Tax=Amorphus sp. 3PC139-8 TaxID=2735676 RepID=UPI00345D1A22
MKYRPLSVAGYEISEEVQRSAMDGFFAEIRNGKAASSMRLQELLVCLGVPDDRNQAYRGADRLLQRARKAGLLEWNRAAGGWVIARS